MPIFAIFLAAIILPSISKKARLTRPFFNAMSPFKQTNVFYVRWLAVLIKTFLFMSTFTNPSSFVEQQKRELYVLTWLWPVARRNSQNNLNISLSLHRNYPT